MTRYDFNSGWCQEDGPWGLERGLGDCPVEVLSNLFVGAGMWMLVGMETGNY